MAKTATANTRDIELPAPLPTLPGSPLKKGIEARAARVDMRRFPGVAEGWSPSDLARYSRGPLSSPHDTLRQEEAEFTRDPQLRRFARDLDKRPLQLKGSRRLRGGRR